MESKIRLYDEEIPISVFGKMVAENNCSRIEGYVCMDCGRYNGYYTIQGLADHLTKSHPNDPKWDATKE